MTKTVEQAVAELVDAAIADAQDRVRGKAQIPLTAFFPIGTFGGRRYDVKGTFCRSEFKTRAAAAGLEVFEKNAPAGKQQWVRVAR